LTLAICAACATACTYERDPHLSPASSEETTFRVVGTAPRAGSIDVSRTGPIEVFFSHPPAAATVVASHVRVYTGLIEVNGDLEADLLRRSVRFTPGSPMRADLRHQVFVHPDLGGLNGATLGGRVVFDFTTGTAVRAPPAPLPTVTSSEVQKAWQAAGCTRGGCHRPSYPPAGVDLSTAAAARRTLVGVESGSGKVRVVAGDHARSYLMLKLLGEGGIDGFRMPSGGARLSNQRLRLVADWIDGGAGE
jgi:hypothetical protein